MAIILCTSDPSFSSVYATLASALRPSSEALYYARRTHSREGLAQKADYRPARHASCPIDRGMPRDRIGYIGPAPEPARHDAALSENQRSFPHSSIEVYFFI